jgi:hypothetical protein
MGLGGGVPDRDIMLGVMLGVVLEVSEALAE